MQSAQIAVGYIMHNAIHAKRKVFHITNATIHDHCTTQLGKANTNFNIQSIQYGPDKNLEETSIFMNRIATENISDENNKGYRLRRNVILSDTSEKL